MNYLQLCQDLRREVRIPGSGPAAVTGQTGQLADLVAWIADAWTELQGDSTSWKWMTSRFTVNTVAADDTYAYTDCTDTVVSPAAVISRFSNWRPYDADGTPMFMSYLTSAGVNNRTFLQYVDWGEFRSVYRNTVQNPGPPIWVAVDPQMNFVLGPAPDAVYTITGDYQRGPQVLTANADTPDMPTRFHKLIVYLAMEKYAGSLASAENMFRAKSEGARLMRQLRRNQIPKFDWTQPLA